MYAPATDFWWKGTCASFVCVEFYSVVLYSRLLFGYEFMITAFDSD